MNRCSISEIAWNDLFEIASFIGQNSNESAIRFLDTAQDYFEKLAEMPRMGTSYEAISQAFHGMRRFPIKGFEKYLIFYIPVGEGIKIARVIHSARDIEKIFES